MNKIEQLIIKEIEGFTLYALNEVLDFIQFIKKKRFNNIKEKRPINNSNIELHTINENEMIHLEDEFKDYKDLYPSNQYIATI